MSIEKINENDLGNVSGGFIFYAENISGADQNNLWEVIDDTTGNNLFDGNGKKICFNNREAAEKYCQDHNMNWSRIDWDTLCEMRSKHN